MATFQSLPAWYSARNWVEEYAIDWTTQSAYNFVASGAGAFGGVTWTPENSANATVLDVVNGTGLRISPVQATDWYNVTRTSPSIWAQLSACMLVGGALKRTDIVALQLRVNPLAISANYEGGWIVCWNGGGSFVVAQRVWNAQGLSALLAINQSGAGGVDATDRGFMEIVWTGGGFYAAVGAWPGSWPLPMEVGQGNTGECTLDGGVNDWITAHTRTPANARVAIHAQRNGSVNAIQQVALGMRILRIEGP